MAVQSQSRLDQARRSFFERGNAPVGQVPDTILRSWRRCQRAGLAAERAPDIEPVAPARLREMRERHERLWRLARAELEGLSADAAAAGSIVLLTDEAGWILDAEGSTGFLDKAGRVALMPGACWGEHVVGTNAIGTAIVEARSVEVRGGEHYLAPHGILSCSASPILDPYGRVAGVLDISGDARIPHLHALGLARRAVASIEHRWFDEGIADAELLRIHHDPALLGTAHEGLLAFRAGRLVAANRAGLQLFGLDRHEIGRARFEALFEEPLSRLRGDGALFDRQGRPLYGTVDDGEAPRRRSHAAPARSRAPGGVAPLFDEAGEALLARARRVLDAGLPVLVQGETGSGKEVFARELHRRCTRSGKAFVAVNCAALPETLIEAELFGYEEGAFTGARKQGSPGLLRQADGGVLFLDEIGDMPLALQPRLLRVLQERELSPLGGGKPVKLDFALVCATHQDLERAIAEGRFRADLYYRIADHVVRLPALRDHADRGALVQALWAQLAQGRRLSADALDALAGYGWPGNLRQLAACLRTLVALSDPGDTLGRDALPAYLATWRPAPSPALAQAEAGRLDALQEAAMRQALADCGGNVTRAAQRLGISRSTLYRKLGAGGQRRAVPDAS
ncbi:sigma-54-dependent Fis family transcriptional regulator [[Pseudomonas] boreopolis]|uniref:Sigma-54-dependent Fis family transcriptional regulator n=1 Tax=Xanthomonas boreopolis TaxID=86183 RepID=A0A919FBZ4_9XANT|nr:sigma-54-dependent Fis family transcriptional regulator [[Pseudomonas] boreopolis]